MQRGCTQGLPTNKYMSKISQVYVPPIHSAPSGGKLRSLTPRAFSTPHHSNPRKLSHKRGADSLLTNDTKPFTATPLSHRNTPHPDHSNPHLIITHPIIDFQPALTENVFATAPIYQQSPRTIKKSAYLSQAALKQQVLDKYLDGVFERVSLRRVRQHRPISFYTHRKQKQAQRNLSMQFSARV